MRKVPYNEKFDEKHRVVQSPRVSRMDGIDSSNFAAFLAWYTEELTPIEQKVFLYYKIQDLSPTVVIQKIGHAQRGSVSKMMSRIDVKLRSFHASQALIDDSARADKNKHTTSGSDVSDIDHPDGSTKNPIDDSEND